MVGSERMCANSGGGNHFREGSYEDALCVSNLIPKGRTFLGG